MPESVEQIFARREEIASLLSVDVGGTILCCHFFWQEDIEFDIDPREVDEQRKAEGLFDFMAQVGRLLGKDVILTPENMQEIVLVRFDSRANTISQEFVGWR